MNSSMNPLAADLDHILRHTRDLWEELRGGRIFVTGGTGFFGCWLLESFVWANDRLKLNASATVLTRSPESFREKAPHLAGRSAITLLEGDLQTFDFPRAAFSHVVHTASESSAHLDETQSLKMLNTIVSGTRRTLEFAVRCGAEKFLFTSSGAVYGNQSPDREFLSEDDSANWKLEEPINLATIYREGKRFSEIECSIFSQATALSAKIARCFAFIGPYLPLDSHFAIGNFMADALRGDSIQVKGDGTPYRSYLYAADLAIWLWTILFRGETARPYNVGSERAMAIAEIAKLTAGLVEPKTRIEIAQRAEAVARPERYVPSTKRAQTELGLREWITLEDGLRKTFAWHVENRKKEALS